MTPQERRLEAAARDFAGAERLRAYVNLGAVVDAATALRRAALAYARSRGFILTTTDGDVRAPRARRAR